MHMLRQSPPSSSNKDLPWLCMFAQWPMTSRAVAACSCTSSCKARLDEKGVIFMNRCEVGCIEAKPDTRTGCASDTHSTNSRKSTGHPLCLVACQ